MQVGFAGRGVEFFFGTLVVNSNVDVGDLPSTAEHFFFRKKIVKNFLRLVFRVPFVLVAVNA